MTETRASQRLTSLCEAAEITAGVVIIGIVLLVTVDVLVRGLGFPGFCWTIAVVTHYAMALVCFLPLVGAPLYRRFLAVEFLTLRGKRISRIVHWLGEVMTMVFVSLTVWQSLAGAISRSKSHQVVEIPFGFLIVWPASWVLPIALGLGLALRLILQRPARVGS